MQTASIQPTQDSKVKTKEHYVFVVQLHSGKYVVGTATNPCRRIAALNSGHNPAIPKALQINRIIGIKPMTADRNTVSVFRVFEDKHGKGNVISV